MSTDATIYIDGAARGNPGPAACAFVISRPGHPPDEQADCLGNLTNNAAEYNGLVRALRRAKELRLRNLVIHSDSELLVKQMNGEYRVKNADLKVLYDEAEKLIDEFESVVIRHVRREQNKRADELCNLALDGGSKPSRSPQAKSSPRSAAPPSDSAVRETALDCLRSAAAVWARGNPEDPPVEAVWDQLWDLIDEAGLLRKRGG